jgi:hypothetical protein
MNNCKMAVAMSVKMFGITMQKSWNYKLIFGITSTIRNNYNISDFELQSLQQVFTISQISTKHKLRNMSCLFTGGNLRR